jgi:hypothetical protein
MATNRCAWLLAGACGMALAACSPASDDARKGWAMGDVTIDGRHYAVLDVALELEPGEEGYYSIHAAPSPDTDVDCVDGLAGGMALYGPIPPSVKRVEDLAGKRLPVEFSGDGDDANLCFVGTEGLLGARDAWVTIESVDGDRARFRMSGEFELYDDGEQVSTLLASARGTAQIVSAP